MQYNRARAFFPDNQAAIFFTCFLVLSLALDVT
jgi:hypothetical protein